MNFEYFRWFLDAAVSTQIMAITLFCMFLLTLIPRILAACGYWARWAAFRLTYYRVENKGEIANLKGGLFARLAKELAARGESNPERLDAYKLAELDATRVHPGLFRADVTGRLADGLEWGFLAYSVCMVFAVIVTGNDAAYLAVGSAVLFGLLKFFAAIFDYKTARERYVLRVGDALERGVGRLYLTKSSAGALRQAAEDLTSALANGVDVTTSAFAEGNKDNALVIKSALDGHEREISKIFAEQTSQTNALREVALRLSAKSDLFEENAELIKTNQKALGEALASFEMALQKITSEMGEAFGKIVEYQARQALQRAKTDD